MGYFGFMVAFGPGELIPMVDVLYIIYGEDHCERSVGPRQQCGAQ